MQTVVLRIFLHGLIFLAPMGVGQNQMSALLVDARQDKLPPEASSCVAAHTPQLQFIPQKAAECAKTADLDCDQDQTTCLCTPVRQSITIDAEVAHSSWQPHTMPAKPLPATPAEEEGEFAYLANLRNLGFQVNPAFQTGSPAGLLDRMTFSFDAIETCTLAGEDRQAGGSDVHTFHFGKVGDNTAGTLNQAIAIRLVAKARIPFDPSTKKVHLVFTSLDAPGAQHVIELAPRPCESGSNSTDRCIDIDLGNERPMIEFGDDTCVDGTGRDFALFYNLLQNPSKWADRLVPIENAAVKIDGAKLAVSDCENPDFNKNPESRPICAMAGAFP
jgi:hypothetical protein